MKRISEVVLYVLPPFVRLPHHRFHLSFAGSVGGEPKPLNALNRSLFGVQFRITEVK